ncbi:hypothetical protein, partial [Roseisolibacter sp. H3M3-2]|uniref:hypothetical protein n=1 Tax=Roseisolibacter sp. H3M3-2 TaxID=3031323 RepID=UPI0023DA106A
GAAAAWFVARDAARWPRAAALAHEAPLVALDGDPFKALCYGWIDADDGRPAPSAALPPLRYAVDRGALEFPDLGDLLGAPEAELRARRAGDPTRTRRHFETHLRLVAPQRRYFVALREAMPGRVVLLPTDDRDGLPRAVRDALAALPPGAPDHARLLAHAAAWMAAHAP